MLRKLASVSAFAAAVCILVASAVSSHAGTGYGRVFASGGAMLDSQCAINFYVSASGNGSVASGSAYVWTLGPTAQPIKVQGAVNFLKFTDANNVEVKANVSYNGVPAVLDLYIDKASGSVDVWITKASDGSVLFTTGDPIAYYNTQVNITTP